SAAPARSSASAAAVRSSASAAPARSSASAAPARSSASARRVRSATSARPSQIALLRIRALYHSNQRWRWRIWGGAHGHTSCPLDPRSMSEHTYLPQLDGIRACAVLSVLVSHFFPPDDLINRLFHFGRAGVVVFFVLSGYL